MNAAGMRVGGVVGAPTPPTIAGTESSEGREGDAVRDALQLEVDHRHRDEARGEQQQRRQHPGLAVLHGELGERRHGDELHPQPARRAAAPSGDRPSAEDPRLRGHAEP